MSTCLKDLAKVIRSKNAGPFELTFDILFEEKRVFESLQKAGAFTKAGMAALYGLAEEEVLDIIYFEPANAVKITIRRPVASGDPGETDVYGAQQHAPLLTMDMSAFV